MHETPNDDHANDKKPDECHDVGRSTGGVIGHKKYGCIITLLILPYKYRTCQDTRILYHVDMSHESRAKKPPFLAFLAAAIVVFFMTLSAADSIGFVPCTFDDTCPEKAAVSQTGSQITATPEPVQQLATIKVPPVHMRIAAIDLDLAVQNPTTTDLEALDIILKQGPARHALSGLLGDDRNMIIFGHSSHLPIVRNQMYKAFNRVPELKVGDSIEVEGEGGATYSYSVTSVTKADASNFDENFLGSPDRKLIIVTCDTLAGKSARYIVRADFVGTSQ